MRTIKDVKWTKQDRANLVKFNSLKQIDALAMQYGYSVEDLRKVANNNYSVEIGANRWPTKQEKLVLVDDYIEGYVNRQTDMAKIIGISDSTLKKWIKELGFTGKQGKFTNRATNKNFASRLDRVKKTFPMLIKAWI